MFVQPANLIAVVAVISNLHPRTECPNRGKLLDCEADSFSGGGEPTIVYRLAPSATPRFGMNNSAGESYSNSMCHIVRSSRHAIYDLVAHNRYRWFGRRDACILPNSDRSW